MSNAIDGQELIDLHTEVLNPETKDYDDKPSRFLFVFNLPEKIDKNEVFRNLVINSNDDILIIDWKTIIYGYVTIEYNDIEVAKQIKEKNGTIEINSKKIYINYAVPDNFRRSKMFDGITLMNVTTAVNPSEIEQFCEQYGKVNEVKLNGKKWEVEFKKATDASTALSKLKRKEYHVDNDKINIFTNLQAYVYSKRCSYQDIGNKIINCGLVRSKLLAIPKVNELSWILRCIEEGKQQTDFEGEVDILFNEVYQPVDINELNIKIEKQVQQKHYRHDREETPHDNERTERYPIYPNDDRMQRWEYPAYPRPILYPPSPRGGRYIPYYFPNQTSQYYTFPPYQPYNPYLPK